MHTTIRCQLCKSDCEHTGRIVFVCADCRDRLRRRGYIVLGVLAWVVWFALGYLTCVAMAGE